MDGPELTLPPSAPAPPSLEALGKNQAAGQVIPYSSRFRHKHSPGQDLVLTSEI